MSKEKPNTVILLEVDEMPTHKRPSIPSAAPKAKRQRAPRQKRAGLIYHYKHDSIAKNPTTATNNEVVNADANQTGNKSNVASHTEVTAMQMDLQRIISRMAKLDQRAKRLLPTEPPKSRQTYLNSVQKLITLLNNFKDRFGGVVMKNTTLTALEAIHWRTSPTSYIHSLAFNPFDLIRTEELTKRLQRTPAEFPTSERDIIDYKSALTEELALLSNTASPSEQLASAQNALYLVYKRMLPSTPEVQRQLDALRSLHSQIQTKFTHPPEVTHLHQSLIEPFTDVSVVPMQ